MVILCLTGIKEERTKSKKLSKTGCWLKEAQLDIAFHMAFTILAPAGFR